MRVQANNWVKVDRVWRRPGETFEVKDGKTPPGVTLLESAAGTDVDKTAPAPMPEKPKRGRPKKNR